MAITYTFQGDLLGAVDVFPLGTIITANYQQYYNGYIYGIFSNAPGIPYGIYRYNDTLTAAELHQTTNPVQAMTIDIGNGHIHYMDSLNTITILTSEFTSLATLTISPPIPAFSVYPGNFVTYTGGYSLASGKVMYIINSSSGAVTINDLTSDLINDITGLYAGLTSGGVGLRLCLYCVTSTSLGIFNFTINNPPTALYLNAINPVTSNYRYNLSSSNYLLCGVTTYNTLINNFMGVVFIDPNDTPPIAPQTSNYTLLNNNIPNPNPLGLPLDINYNFYFVLNAENYPLYSADAFCFNKGTKILCMNKQLDDEYVDIELLKVGDFVKTFKHGYRKVSKTLSGSFRNNPKKWNMCMYKMAKTESNGLIEDLIVTGGHSILVDSLSDADLAKYKEMGIPDFANETIDNKHLVLSCVSDQFTPMQDNSMYNYYHLLLENNDDEEERFGIWANGVLTETPNEKTVA
jgi:hypothetical protein